MLYMEQQLRKNAIESAVTFNGIESAVTFWNWILQGNTIKKMTWKCHFLANIQVYFAIIVPWHSCYHEWFYMFTQSLSICDNFVHQVFSK